MLRALALTLLVACAGSSTKAPTAPASKPFAMKTYTIVLLRRGPAWTGEQTPETKKLFEGHMANIKAMGRARKLLVAGPFDAPESDTQAPAGLFIFDVTDRAELDRLLAGDPAIAAGRFVPKVLPWYGPAGLTYDGVEESFR